jgi:NADH-quinone oxidoreductase subunit K
MFAYNYQLNFLDVSGCLFLIGISGMLVIRKNLISLLMSLEILLLAVNLNFVLFSLYLDDAVGFIFSLMILTVAAAESAIGLAILISHYRLTGEINIEEIGFLKG